MVPEGPWKEKNKGLSLGVYVFDYYRFNVNIFGDPDMKPQVTMRQGFFARGLRVVVEVVNVEMPRRQGRLRWEMKDEP